MPIYKDRWIRISMLQTRIVDIREDSLGEKSTYHDGCTHKV
jgi:hypothetical protein